MCKHIKLPGGNSLLVCGLRSFGKLCSCGRDADFLCDWKVSARKSGTCDQPICAQHAKQVMPGKHLCPKHQLLYDEWKRKHPGAVIPEQPSLFEEAA